MRNNILGILKDRKFTVDTLWLVSSQGILIISGFLVNLIIGYQFGAATLGVFNQVLGFYLILSTFISLGINNCLIQKISSGLPQQYKGIFSSNFAITTVSAILFSAAILLISYSFPSVFSSPELAKALFIATLSLPFFNWNKNFMAFATGTRNQKLFSNVRSFRWLIIIGFVAAVTLVSADPIWIYYSFLAAEVILFVFCFAKFSNLLTINFAIRDIKSNLSFGLKSFFAEAFSILNDKLDLIIIGYLISSTEVGIYSFLIFFAKSMYIIPGTLQQNINPLIGKHWFSNTMEELNKTLKNIRNVNIAVVLVQAVAILIFYKILIAFYKPEFAGSWGYLALSMLGIIPFALISWGGSILVMTGKLKENILRTLILLLFTVLTTFIFTFFFGFTGAIWAVVANGIFAFLLLFGLVKRETGIRLV
ncbi:oligosaccharide flippase family protein [Cognataquiflexum rubidum]|uniref:oligosaccharide flippase family protein n=1 Tax=Cognataquiflexum rubidum TaxID=2922273 RepID=UPI001F1478BD|nr:oligosaccharide flippase family protein [Cognataquiflexum rubidum]MCH6233083.1 oligosaccharide flippase family protein [Cognataquiflexum rubidum]